MKLAEFRFGTHIGALGIYVLAVKLRYILAVKLRAHTHVHSQAFQYVQV